VRDALKNYIALATGLTEVGRQRAVAASKALVAQGEATVEQVGSLAEDLVQTSRHNRDLVTALVRSEVDKALARVGPATAAEVRRLTGRLQALESTLRRRDAKPAAKPAPAKKTAAATPAAKPAAKPAARKPAARKPAATKPATKATKSAKPAAKKPAKKPAKKAPAKPAAKKAPAKPAAKQAPAKRSGS
jgi:polyhydroxyalkanoate synthesis regulator phasin